MGETLPLFVPEFNASVVVESKPERLSSDAGALLLREVEQRLGVMAWLARKLHDPREPQLITHPLLELLRTHQQLLAQGWRDKDDADPLRYDPVLRLAVSTRRGTGPLMQRAPSPDDRPLAKNPAQPDGLASQPTLSRLVAACSAEGNRDLLREALLMTAARRIKTMRRGHRPRYVTIDVDSLPLEVAGQQPGAEYNGHYHARIFHPLIAAIAEYGDIIDARLRPGNVHTADGALGFIVPLLDRVERELCQVATVRIDAGFPDEEVLGGLEGRRTGYVARIKTNPVLDRMAEPHLTRPAGRPPAEPREWLHELSYRAEAWSRERRVVLVVLERPGQLLLDYFYLITNLTTEQMDGAALLELYRERGTAEGHLGEFKDVLEPALSSSPRGKRHYRGYVPLKRYPTIDSFANNEVTLLLNALAYEHMHALRELVARATREGWSLRRLRERILKVAARVVVHGRRATVCIAHSAAGLWEALWGTLRLIRTVEVVT